MNKYKTCKMITINYKERYQQRNNIMKSLTNKYQRKLLQLIKYQGIILNIHIVKIKIRRVQHLELKIFLYFDNQHSNNIFKLINHDSIHQQPSIQLTNLQHIYFNTFIIQINKNNFQYRYKYILIEEQYIQFITFYKLMKKKQRYEDLDQYQQQISQSEKYLIQQEKRKEFPKSAKIKQLQPSSSKWKLQINKLQADKLKLQTELDELKCRFEQNVNTLAQVQKQYKDLQERYSRELKKIRNEKQYYGEFYDKYKKLENQSQMLKIRQRGKINQLKNKIIHFQHEKQYQNQQKEIQVRMLKQQVAILKTVYQSNLQQYQATKKLLDQIQNQSSHINILHLRLIQKQQQTNKNLLQTRQKNKDLQAEILFNKQIFEKVEEQLKKFVKNQEFLYRKWQQLKKQNQKLKKQRKNQKYKIIKQFLNQIQKQKQKQKSINLEQQLKNIQNYILKQIVNKQKQKQKQKIQKYQRIIQQKQIEIQYYKKQLDDKNKQILIQKQYFKNIVSQLQKLKIEQYKNELEVKNYLKQNKFLRQNLSELKLLNQALKLQQIQKSSVKIIQQKNNIYVNNKIMSYILKYKNNFQEQLITNIQTACNKSIKNVQLLFKQDSYHLNFAPYLTKKINLLLILLIKQTGRICGAFCNSQHIKSQGSFIFSFLDNRIIMFQKQKEVDNIKSYQFAQNYLTFGNNEMVIKNNNQNMIMKLQMASFSSKFYKTTNRNAVTGMNENQVKYQFLELHKVDF